MRDPHVERLTYRLTTDDSVSFDNPPPLERETDEFRMRLEDGVVTFEMKTHHASEATARRSVEGWLRSWEVHLALQAGTRSVRFEFERSVVVDRYPPGPGEGAGVIVGVGRLHISGVAPTLHVTRREYPEPPKRFRLSEDVDNMWLRFQQYRQGKEPLASMAYACATFFSSCSARHGHPYNVSERILSTLRRLGTEVGDSSTARKFIANSTGRPHTPAEVAWVEAAVKALIRRMGEYEAEPMAPLEQLTMAELPPL